MKTVYELAQAAKAASCEVALAACEEKNRIINAVADAILARADELLAANAEDLSRAEQNGIRPAMIDRLRLTNARIKAMAEGARLVAELADPIGEVLEDMTLKNGIEVKKVRVPLGVIGIIFESRPNVTLDAAVLCLKSGNATVLRGGKEAISSNRAIVRVMRDAISACGMNPDVVCLIEDTDRSSATELMNAKGLIDVLIPRGGAGLIRSVVENARVPVIETGSGNCHLYIDCDADLKMGIEVLVNAKCSRPSVCNAVETVLVHEAVAEKFLPAMADTLSEYSVELRACPKALAILGESAIAADDEDWMHEYNDYILAVRVVSSLSDACEHISRCGTMHSECIITENASTAEEFLNRVDAAAVYHNASTRFTDGFEFGLGAEIGISTQKMHARGPMGLKELTSYKYRITGNGQVRK